MTSVAHPLGTVPFQQTGMDLSDDRSTAAALLTPHTTPPAVQADVRPNTRRLLCYVSRGHATAPPGAGSWYNQRALTALRGKTSAHRNSWDGALRCPTHWGE
jgi:hypothetical protein